MVKFKNSGGKNGIFPNLEKKVLLSLSDKKINQAAHSCPADSLLHNSREEYIKKKNVINIRLSR